MFKPETTSRCLRVVVLFLKERFPEIHITTHSDIILKTSEVLSLYGNDMPQAVKLETVGRLANRPLTVIQVSDGKQAVEHIAMIRGSNVDPSKCEPGTLRRMLYNELGCEPEEVEGGFKYYPNFVHIPQNDREVQVCEGLFGKYFNK